MNNRYFSRLIIENRNLGTAVADQHGIIVAQRAEIVALREILGNVVFGFDHEMIGKGFESLLNAIIAARAYLDGQKEEQS